MMAGSHGYFIGVFSFFHIIDGPSWQPDGSRNWNNNAETQFGFFVRPFASDLANRGIPLRLRKAKRWIRFGRNTELSVPQRYAAYAIEQPAGNSAIGVVVQRIMHCAVGADTVPGLPDGGGSLLDRIEPAGAILLQKQSIGCVHMSIVGQNPAQVGGGQETGVQMIPAFDHQIVQGIRRLLVFVSVQQPEGNDSYI